MIDVGTYKQKTLLTQVHKTTKPIKAAVPSCGCTFLSYDEYELKFTWRLPEFPFQINSDTFEAGMSVEVWYTDNSKETIEFKATIIK
jgi:hypothetical protein